MSAMRNKSLRRVVLSAVGTVSGVVLLLSLKPHTPPVVSAQPPAATPSPSVTTAPSPSGPAKPTASPTLSRSPSVPPDRARRPTHTPTTSQPASRTVTGGTVQTRYGPVQVRITLSGERITAASALQSPSSSPRSEKLSSRAIPQLNKRTLAAQSADIDAVSGASYTSQGYISSLQSALDRAGA